MTFRNRITDLFNIDYPIVQAGMIWASGWRLASAVSNSGGLGIIGSGSMYPDVLREHIQKCKAATTRPFGVNVPLLYPDIDKHIRVIIEEKVPIIFTSAGNPKTWTSVLKREGCKVVHVVSSSRFAKNATSHSMSIGDNRCRRHSRTGANGIVKNTSGALMKKYNTYGRRLPIATGCRADSSRIDSRQPSHISRYCGSVTNQYPNHPNASNPNTAHESTT